ncbi:hypothetical protein TWF694_000657 [Orbilia ellipsospora]|uniref:Uncharacterized protein n=1 Tax=Orbilia ellipsospora TaxID=2528407 RepID=A0AAV9XP89_9PEZI
MMDLYLFLDWVRWTIVRLFISFGILTILPIFLLLLLEPLVYLFRFVEGYLPSSIARKKPVRKASISISNLSSIASDSNPGQTGTSTISGVRNRERNTREAETVSVN